MIYLVSSRVYPASNVYSQVTLQDFHDWFLKQDAYQLDIETNVVERITERVIYTVQFGSMDGITQYVLDLASFDLQARDYVKWCLGLPKTKYIFYALFEYPVIKQYLKVDISNIFDVYLTLKVCLNGSYIENHLLSLAGAVKEYLGIELSKEEQTSFNGGMLTESQVVYAARDVIYLSALQNRIQSWEQYRFLKNTIDLENEAVRAFGDMLVNGFVFDKEIWQRNIDWAVPQIEEAKEKVFSYIRSELADEVKILGFLKDKDELTLNWKSTKDKHTILSYLYPELQNFKVEALKKFEKTLPEGNFVKLLVDKKYDEANNILIVDHYDFLVSNNLLIPEGSITINLNSPDQRLRLFKLVEPWLPNTNNTELIKCRHPMIKDYITYIEKEKLRSSYGEGWFENVECDGKIRPKSINQIVSTGRISMSPGFQTIPADDFLIFNKYREAFKPEPGWKLCACDYSSQELALIAYLSGEEVWIDAIRTGKDLHSVSAYKVFGQRWIDVGGTTDGQFDKKTASKEAKKLRDYAKTVSFGLAYGMGPKKLAERLSISIQEAREIMAQYFITFPKIKKFLEEMGTFGVKNGFIFTLPPYSRIRYFPDWNASNVPDEILASIERESKNTPIQGSGADQTKKALVLIKEYIESHHMQDGVKIILQLHDATLTSFRPDLYPTWPDIHKQLMRDAANINVPGYLIDATCDVTDHWTK